MKRVILPALVALAFVSFDAAAQCSIGTKIDNLEDLQKLLAGNTVCATRGSSEKWQEQHRGSGSGGELWDYKEGEDDSIDPTKKLGTWEIIGTGSNPQVQHIYDTFGPETRFTFDVYRVGTGVAVTYNFCGVGGAQDVLGATIREKEVSCD